MRILLVHNFYRIPGGEDSLVLEESSLLAKSGLDVELFSVHSGASKNLVSKIIAASGLLYNPYSRFALWRKLVSFSPDIVHIHNLFPLLSPSVLDACRDAGVPAVLTLHNFRILCPTGFLYTDELNRDRSLRGSCWWTIPKRVYQGSTAATLALAATVEFHKRVGTWKRKVSRFIALTESAKHKFIEGGLPADRIVVKPNCVAKPPALRDLPRQGALFVGRLDEQKGVGVLLEAWRNIDYPLRIIGDGPLSNLVVQNTSDRIVYLGRQPRDAVQREMQTAKFLILPSMWHEMFPMTVLEAFASRLPVICSDLPSLKNLVAHGVTGLKFPPGDATALAAQVRWAIFHPSELEDFGGQALSTYEEQYTPEINLKHLIRIYSSLVAERWRGANQGLGAGGRA